MHDNSYELLLTYKCNWFCDYCLIDTHNQPRLPFEKVLKEAHRIPPNSEVTLTGGEPGLLSKSKLRQVIDILKAKDCDIDILTNGVLFKKHWDLVYEFGEVIYHCVEYLGEDIEYPDLDQSVVTYILVIGDENLRDGSIINMIEKYPHIKFLLLPDVRPQRKINLNLFMNFMKEHKDKVHPRTMEDFVVDISRLQNKGSKP